MSEIPERKRGALIDSSLRSAPLRIDFKPMTQEERSERSRTQILDAALKLFSHRGYGATSVRDIAEAAGLSKGNVYHHFPDKESIFRALLDQYFSAMSRP